MAGKARLSKLPKGTAREERVRERRADAALPAEVGRPNRHGFVPACQIAAAAMKDAVLRFGLDPKGTTARRLRLWLAERAPTAGSVGEAGRRLAEMVPGTREAAAMFARLSDRMDHYDLLEAEIGGPVPTWACAAGKAESYAGWRAEVLAALERGLDDAWAAAATLSSHERMEIALDLEEPVGPSDLAKAEARMRWFDDVLDFAFEAEFGIEGVLRIRFGTGRPRKGQASYGSARRHMARLLLARMCGYAAVDEGFRAKAAAWMASIEAARREKAVADASALSPASLAALLGLDRKVVKGWLDDQSLPTANVRVYRNHWGRRAEIATVDPKVALELVSRKLSGRPLLPL